MLIPPVRLPMHRMQVGFLVIVLAVWASPLAAQRPSFLPSESQTTAATPAPSRQQDSSGRTSAGWGEPQGGSGPASPYRQPSEPPPWAVGPAAAPRAYPPPPTAPVADQPASPPIGFWREGQGQLWQALQEGQPQGMSRPGAPASTRGFEQPRSSAETGNVLRQDPGPASQSAMLRQVPPNGNDRQSPWYRPESQPSDPAWSAPQGPPGQNTTNPAGPWSAQPDPSQVARESSPPTGAAGMSAPPAYEQAGPGGQPASSGSPPGSPSNYTSAPSSSWMAGSPRPEAQSPGVSSQAQAPLEDPNLKIQRLRQQYQIGASTMHYTGSHNMSTLQEAPRWTGPAAVVPPASTPGPSTGPVAPAR
jgi:hypothetical protein